MKRIFFQYTLAFSALMTPVADAIGSNGETPGQETAASNDPVAEVQVDETEAIVIEPGKKGQGQLKFSTKDGKIKLFSADGKHEFSIKGRVFLDTAYFHTDKTAMYDNTEIRKLYLGVEGKSFGVWGYELQVDFSEDATEIKDGKISYIGVRNGVLDIGFKKVNFSLDNLISSNNISFMERGLPDAFVPDRSLGVEYRGWTEQGTYSVGVWAANASGTDDADVRWSGGIRVTGVPWKKKHNLFHIGANYFYNGINQLDSDDGFALQYSSKPESSLAEKEIETKEWSEANNVDLYDLELAFVYGPGSLQAEYIGAYPSLTGYPDPSFDGWYLYGTYFITGEHRPYNHKKGAFGRVIPKRSVSKGGLGAVEIGLRYSTLDLEYDTSTGTEEGGELTDITFGVNWYLETNLRVMFNYIYVDANPYSSDGVQGEQDKPWLLQARFQVDW